MIRAATQRGDVLDGDDPPIPHDRDRVAHPLDLIQVVRGQEDRASAVAVLADHRHELLLHQRVKPGRRLVEHQQLRVVEQRLDQPDLLSVPARQIAHPSAEVRFEMLRQDRRRAEDVHAPGGGAELEELAAGEPRIAR